MKSLLKNGCLAGLAGGLALALFMVTFGRGPINDAIALEDSLIASVANHDDGSEASDHSHPARTHEDLFTRGVQEIGGVVGLLLFGLGVGIIFAVVLGATAGRLGAGSGFEASIRLGVIGFWSVVVIPFLKLPANPPAVGDPETINQRTMLYFAVVFASIVVVVLVSNIVRGSDLGAIRGGWLAAALYGLGLGIIFLVMPDNPDEVTAPADLVWRFRLASLGGLAVLWTVVALTVGTLVERQAQRSLDGPDRRTISESVAHP